jgi:uncharacterized secreted protein with C-terminal beta-propeller domain
MRDVRPPTAADGDWAESEEGNEALIALHARLNEDARRVRRRRERMSRMRRRAWMPVALTAGVTAIVVILSVALGGVERGGSGPDAAGPAMRPAAQLLSYESSCSQLLRTLRKQSAAHIVQVLESASAPVSAEEAMPYAHAELASPPVQAAESDTPAGGTSITNVQEGGVDEPDIVKTDGDRVVSITAGVLRVQNAADGAIVGSLDLSNYVSANDAQLLVDGDHALVLLGAGGTVSAGGPFSPPLSGQDAARSTYLFVDLSGQPRVTGSFRADGSYLDARMVGTTVRIVQSSSPTFDFTSSYGNVAAEQKVISRAPLSVWLPSYTVTDSHGTATEQTVPCSDVAHPADFSGSSMLSVYTLDLAHLGTAVVAPATVAADGSTVYATQSSLYIASEPEFGRTPSASGGQPAETTEIHRFDIAGSGTPTYLGSATVPGHLLDSYALSDYAGDLRVATTSGYSMAVAPKARPLAGAASPTASTPASSEQSSVYVLDDDTLKLSGHVGGLGKGEQIYAVRYEGPLAYVVTFKQTDPLYVLDLHNPAHPSVAGALELTGYSDYLHDAGDGRLIGVGQQANAQGRVAGMQVSLFDVGDPTSPERASQVVVPHAVGENDVDPHAFLYWQPTGLIVVPLDSWSNNAGRVLVLRLDGTNLTKLGTIANPKSGPASYLGIRRSVLVNGMLWTLSNGGVKITQPDDLTQQAWVPFS